MAKLKFITKPVSCWNKLREEYDNISQSEHCFIFHGQVIKKKKKKEKNTPDPITSFERALLDVAPPKTPLDGLLLKGLEGVPVLKLEEGLLREFERKCSLYLDTVPSEAAFFCSSRRPPCPCLGDLAGLFYISTFGRPMQGWVLQSHS